MTGITQEQLDAALAKQSEELLDQVARMFDVEQVPQGSPELPRAMFQTADGVFNAYALLSANQVNMVKNGKNPGMSVQVWVHANRSAGQVKRGEKTIAALPKYPDDRLDALKIWQYMYDNPDHFGQEWLEVEGNEKPADF